MTISSVVEVAVLASFPIDGIVKPVAVVWKDGRQFDIEKITDFIRIPKRDNSGFRYIYKCIIAGVDRCIYYNDDKWYLECRKEQQCL